MKSLKKELDSLALDFSDPATSPSPTVIDGKHPHTYIHTYKLSFKWRLLTINYSRKRILTVYIHTDSKSVPVFEIPVDDINAVFSALNAIVKSGVASSAYQKKTPSIGTYFNVCMYV
jgi:hypothetical protein